MGKFIFVIPIFLLLVAAGVYGVLIPEIYGETVSVVDWFLTDSTHIVKTLSTGKLGVPKVRGIVVLEIFWWIWLASFIVSLFFVGRRLQNPEENFDDEAVMIKIMPTLQCKIFWELLGKIQIEQI